MMRLEPVLSKAWMKRVPPGMNSVVIDIDRIFWDDYNEPLTQGYPESFEFISKSRAILNKKFLLYFRRNETKKLRGVHLALSEESKIWP